MQRAQLHSPSNYDEELQFLKQVSQLKCCELSNFFSTFPTIRPNSTLRSVGVSGRISECRKGENRNSFAESRSSVGRGVFSFISLFVAMATSHTARARAVGHALAGVNATQVKLVGSDTTSTSHGYASYTVGGGFSILYKSKASLSLDALYTNRKFGFGITSADFSTIQLPIMARFHTPILYVGAGVYSALWSFKGEMLTDGKSKRVKVSDAGQSATEFGFLLSTGMKRSILGLPLLFEVRRFQSINDLAKSNTLKGSLIEWQILVGYQFNDELPAATSAVPAATSAVPAASSAVPAATTAVPAEKTRPIAPPPLILRKRKLSIDAIDTSDTGVVIQPPELPPAAVKVPSGGLP